MNNISIFLASPISGFNDELQYIKNRQNLFKLIDKLKTRFRVYSEILNISVIASYDNPGQSAIKDFREILESDIFIMYHPMNMQTSTFIELGYAVAKQKKIIIIAKPDALPFLALGLSEFSPNIKIIPSSHLNESVLGQVEFLIDELLK